MPLPEKPMWRRRCSDGRICQRWLKQRDAGRMYNDFFGFRESPFTITLDPRYLYLSERHQEALAADAGPVSLTEPSGGGYAATAWYH